MTSVAALDDQGLGLRVDFFWRQDRYAHRIVAVAEAGERVLLESVEGTSAEPWPTAPPLQQLSVEEPSRGAWVGLLVGMAGKSHWSMSVEPLPGTRRIAFDVACRLRESPALLGSTYRPAAPGNWTSDGPLAMACAGDFLANGVRLVCRLSGCRDEGLTTRVRASEHLRLEPLAESPSVPGTARWKYVCELAAVS